jgi:hypothetical protein
MIFSNVKLETQTAAANRNFSNAVDSIYITNEHWRMLPRSASVCDRAGFGIIR